MVPARATDQTRSQPRRSPERAAANSVVGLGPAYPTTHFPHPRERKADREFRLTCNTTL